MSIRKKLHDALSKRKRISQLVDGAEKCDPKPLIMPTGLKQPVTQEQRFKRMMLQHQEQLRESSIYRDETDFDIDEDDIDMLTPYEQAAEIYEMEPVLPDELQAGGVSGEQTPSPALDSSTVDPAVPPGATEPVTVDQGE